MERFKMNKNKVPNNSRKKPWFKKPWGIALAVLFFPFFVIWFAWGISRLNILGKIGVTIAALFMILVYSAFLFPSTTELKEVRYRVAIKYEVENKDAPELAKGETEVQQEGKDGEKIITYRITYTSGVENKKDKISEIVTKEPVNKILLIGTKVASSSPENTSVSGTTNTTQPPNSQAYYANCTEARNAGAAPIYQGSPGYREALDRDRDGIACE